jgi:hypothetical protein
VGTSRFWASRVGRWLSSSKNITGATLSVFALGAQALFGLGAFWPLVVVASYAVGALVAPRERLDLRGVLTGSSAMSASDLTAQLKALRRTVSVESRRLPPGAVELTDRILGALDEVVARWDVVAGAADQGHVVEQLALDYVPTTLQKYLNLPRTFALTSRVEGKKSAADELIEQLTILATESERIRTAVYAKDLDALGDQGRFLREKFTKSPLDL